MALPRRVWRRVLLCQLLFLAARASFVEENWATVAKLFNSGQFAEAIELIDRCLEDPVLDADEPLRAQIGEIRKSAYAKAHPDEGAQPAAYVARPEVGALPGPPSTAPQGPSANREPCDATRGVADRECLAAAMSPSAAATAAAAACATDARPRSEQTRLDAELGVCAHVSEGSNAQLYDWVHSQLCAGAVRLEVLDSRPLGATERAVAAWMLQPLVHDGRLILANASAPEPEGRRGQCAGSPAAEWAYTGRTLAGAAWAHALPKRECGEEDAARERFYSACVARSATLAWVALARAPFELLLPGGPAEPRRADLGEDLAPTVGALLEASARGVCAKPDADASLVSAVRLPFVDLSPFAGSARERARLAAAAAPHLPERPLLATHVLRPAQWGVCALPASLPLGEPTACVRERDTLLVVRPRAWLRVGPPGLCLLLPPGSTRLRAARTRVEGEDGRETEGEPPRDVVDWFGRTHQSACDRRAHTVPGADGSGGPAEGSASEGAWMDESIRRMTAGDGLVVLPAVGEAGVLQSVGAAFLSLLPEARKHGVTQAFTNNMCQAVRGAAQSVGYQPDCRPVHPAMLELAYQPAVLALARRLLGRDCILHNTGISLVGDLSFRSVAAHQDQPLPTGEPHAWAGRVPPPSHPLALQALWPLDPFEYENGPTFLLPRTQQQPARLEAWLANGSDPIGGLFPVRYLTAEVGDCALFLGNAWHGAASHLRSSERVRGRPRLGLLFEYSPGFVEPKHRYAPAMLEALVPRELRALFPALDVDGAAVADPECGEGGLHAVSVWDWPREMRSRPQCVRAWTRVVLRGGRGAMPVFGLGTGSPQDDPRVVAQAIRGGYRLVDSAQLYGNEHIIREAVRLSGVHREALFLATKAGEWCPGWYATPRETLARAVCVGGYEQTWAAALASLERLGTSYLDLYLLHWPMSPEAPLLDPANEHSPMDLSHPAHASARLAGWRALLELRRQGLARAVGVCNFSVRQLEQLRLATGELPDVLQLELHPLLQRPELRLYCERHGILLQSYGNHHADLVRQPVLQQLAASLPALAKLVSEPVGILCMRWALQTGAAILPRSSKLEYIGANKMVFWSGLRKLLSPAVLDLLRTVDANRSLYGAHHLFVEDAIA